MSWQVNFGKSPDELSMEKKMEAKKYILCLLNQTKFLFDNYFYEFQGYEPQTIEIYLPGDATCGGSHALYEDYHEIKINIAWLYFKDAESYGKLLRRPVSNTKLYLREKILDLAILIHEYAHSIYDEIIGGHKMTKFRTDNSAEIVITEGFSMISRIIIIDALNEETESMKKVGLTHNDIIGLKRFSLNDNEELIKHFRNGNPDKNIYVEGLHSLIYPIYNEFGLGGLGRLLKIFDFYKIVRIRRDAPEYLEALGNVSKIIKLFCK